jgi:hypothetical protein
MAQSVVKISQLQSISGSLGNNDLVEVSQNIGINLYTSSKATMAQVADFITIPVGGVIAWMLSLVGTPALPNRYVQCNGQVLTDPQSPYSGSIIPNLNGTNNRTQRFLRGSTTSGATGGSDTNIHSHSSTLTSACFYAGSGTMFINTWDYNERSGDETISVLPSYYEIVWIMRIK